MKRSRALWTMLGICLIALAARAAAQAADETITPLGDRELQAKVAGLHEHIWSHFIHPTVNLVYDYIAPPGSSNPWGHLPTPKEIKASQPNACGWGAGMEDCSINTGAYLAGMVERYAITRQPAHAEEARRLYRGLRLLGTVAPRKGFVARGVLPDGKSFYTNSSVDQYTFYVYGMWTYFHSPIATETEKGEIRAIMHDICARIEDDGFDILAADGKPALVSDVGVIRSDRSSRLLELYRVGADVTGEPHWLDIYKEKTAENKYARLRDVTTPSRVDTMPWKTRQSVYGILQNQVSLMPLLALEDSLPIRACYLEALRLDARLVDDRMAEFRQYRPAIHNDNYTLGGWRVAPGVDPRSAGMQKEFRFVRGPAEALVVMLLANGTHLNEPLPAKQPTATKNAKPEPKPEPNQEELAREYMRKNCRELLTTYDFTKMRTFSCIYPEIAYWLAVKQGLLKYETGK